MDFGADLQLELSNISKKKAHIRKVIATLPEGKFSCRISEHRDKWYRITYETDDKSNARNDSRGRGRSRSNGRNSITGDGPKMKKRFTYIPKANEEEAKKLAYKTYLSLKLEDLDAEEQAIVKCRDGIRHNCGRAEFFRNNPGVSRLITPILAQGEEKQLAWQEGPYQKNMDHPEGLNVPTIGGFNVRSKSEALIANLLWSRKIPFRYECMQPFGRKNFFPDFTIRSPLDNRIVIWEHFGMMNDLTYQSEYWSKMSKYLSGGFIPYYNLITTFETNERPFDAAAADRIIRMMFEK